MLMPPLAPTVTLKGEPIKIRFVKDLVSTTNTGLFGEQIYQGRSLDGFQEKYVSDNP